MIVNSKMPEVIVDNLSLNPEEFCYVVYMPIKVGNRVSPPSNLFWVWPLIDSIKNKDWVGFDYWYLTVKHMWIQEGYGNREGWHIDSFGTDDVNYIWSDCIPTEFSVQEFDLSSDHDISMEQMTTQAKACNSVKFKDNTLLRLDNTMVHRPSYIDKSVLRTFIKVSCSNHIYNLKGNATNPNLDTSSWVMKERTPTRNHPIK